MKTQIISKEIILPSIWDGGETFEYFIYPENATYTNKDFLFRISAATITKVPSTFTKFDNYERFLMMLDNDLRIIRNGKEEIYAPKDIFKFKSNNEIVSHTKGNDFNLMVNEKISDVDVFFLNDYTKLNQHFIFCFAITDSLVSVNENNITLKKNNLLLIENSEKENVLIHSKSSILISALSV